MVNLGPCLFTKTAESVPVMGSGAAAGGVVVGPSTVTTSMFGSPRSMISVSPTLMGQGTPFVGSYMPRTVPPLRVAE